MSSRPRILLLNPPGSRSWGRGLFQGCELEPEFLPPPADLAVLSGTLAAVGVVSVIDAVAAGLKPGAALKRCVQARPDAVFALAAGISYAEDTAFLTSLKAALPGTRLIGIGDIYRDIGEMALSLHPFLDAVLLDWSTPDALDLLDPPRAPVDNAVYLGADGVAVAGPSRHARGPWDCPEPRWELFDLARYRLPLLPAGPAAAVLGEFGCPYLCTYCPQSGLGHKWRAPEAVAAEGRRLRELGARGALIADATFGVHPARTRRFLESWPRHAGLPWAAWTRVDLARPDLLAAMRAAGCSAVGLGIDSGDTEILRGSKKSTTREQARRAVAAAAAAGLKTWGLFVVGFGMDTQETVEATLEFSRELDLDHRSYRVETSRLSSDYRRDLLVKGLVPPEAMPPDVPTTSSVWQGRLGIANRDVLEYQRRAAAGLSTTRR